MFRVSVPVRAVVFAYLAASLSFLPNQSAQAGDGYGPRPQTWTGFYVGAHLGHGWGEWDGKLQYDAGLGPVDIFNGKPERTIDASGWLGGGQVGFNYQKGSLVVGLEVDGSFTGMDGAENFVIDPDNDKNADYTWRIKTRIDALGTARLRLGFANGPLLLYGTAGLAFARTSQDLTVTCHAPQCGGFAPLVTARGSAEENHLGYAVGGGLEWMMGQGWSMKAEYVYVNLGEANNRMTGTAYPNGPSPPFPAPFPHTTDSLPADLTIHTVRVGVNYRFGN